MIPVAPEHAAPQEGEARGQGGTAPAPAIAATVADDRETIKAGDTVMLVIEDDRQFARIVGGIVREKGFKCLIACDGESGVALAARYRPVGIVLDVGLPDIDGWSVMERLRALPATRNIPVHVISGSDAGERARALGAVGFLTKPVSEIQIGDALGRIIKAGGGIRRLVLADPDGGARKALAGLIEADDLEIVEARDGAAVTACLRAGPVDCLVLDVDLPGGGTGLLEALGHDWPEGLPPLIIVSAHDLSRDETTALRAFTDTIIVKSGRSDDRLLNEIRLFLHSVDAKLPGGRHQSPAVAGGDPALTGRTILVVDDDMRNSFALSKVLRGRGLRVLMAQDGRKALTQLDNNPAIELVVMDIMMPGMDGYQTMREIRKETRWAALPIIAVTAKAMMGDRGKCLEAGATDYLAKPIDTDELLDMMTRYIGA